MGVTKESQSRYSQVLRNPGTLLICDRLQTCSSDSEEKVILSSIRNSVVTFLHLRLHGSHFPIFLSFLSSQDLCISITVLCFLYICVPGDGRGKLGAAAPRPLQTVPTGFLMPSRQRILGSAICLGPAGSVLVQFIMAEVIEAHAPKADCFSGMNILVYCSRKELASHVRYLDSMQINLPRFLYHDLTQHTQQQNS